MGLHVLLLLGVVAVELIAGGPINETPIFLIGMGVGWWLVSHCTDCTVTRDSCFACIFHVAVAFGATANLD